MMSPQTAGLVRRLVRATTTIVGRAKRGKRRGPKPAAAERKAAEINRHDGLQRQAELSIFGFVKVLSYFFLFISEVPFG